MVGAEYCVHFAFLCTPFRHFLFSLFWTTGTRLAVMSIQDQLICVCLVMPRCMFSMQLFFSEIVKFRFDRK